jgi:hypothetical protein
MTEQRTAGILRLHAVVSLALGVLLVLDSWDGLYDALDLPQAFPALLTQVGGAVVIAGSYLLWQAAARPGELRQAVATAAAAASGAAALIIAAWLIFRGKADLGIDTQGVVELIVAAVVLGALALAEAAIAGRRTG